MEKRKPKRSTSAYAVTVGALLGVLVAALSFSIDAGSRKSSAFAVRPAQKGTGQSLFGAAERRPDRSLKRNGPVVYLTFDDGPDQNATPLIMRTLRRRHVVATFFVVGRNAAKYPALVRMNARNGNSIQNHTWNHPDLKKLNDDQVISEVDSTSQIITRLSGRKPTCLRPPYDSADTRIRNIVGKKGMHLVRWTIDSEDWKRPGANVLISSVVSQVRPGSIILMHDAGGINRDDTTHALGHIIDQLKDSGYHFGLLCE